MNNEQEQNKVDIALSTDSKIVNMRHLNLYMEDFVSNDVWQQVCDSLGVDASQGDSLTVYVSVDTPSKVWNYED